jgi:hypothetical protein
MAKSKLRQLVGLPWAADFKRVLKVQEGFQRTTSVSSGGRSCRSTVPSRSLRLSPVSTQFLKVYVSSPKETALLMCAAADW